MTTTTLTRTRPVHYGAWMEYYDGREKMEAAGRAAWADAAAAEVEGVPTAETAAEWLQATTYAIATYGGGLAEFSARPSELDERLRLVRKALMATAYVVRGYTREPPTMKLDTVGHHWYHALMSLAFATPWLYRPDWELEQRGRTKWLADVKHAAQSIRSQWRNADNAWLLERIASWLFPGDGR